MNHPRKPNVSSAEDSAQRPQKMEAFLHRQQSQDLLRFMTCGSIGAGKSTLIGRLPGESHQQHGTDGITVDLAYRFFTSTGRNFMAVDTPGHEQHTRDMVTAASTAQVAVLLVDASKGILPQTRRNAYLVSLMGIRHVVLVINKMDLVGYAAAAFNATQEEFGRFCATLQFDSVTAIPLSALKDDNITQRSANTPWYAGPTLMGCLETVKVAHTKSTRLVFTVQCVNQPDDSFRGFSGTVAEGRVRVGDEVRVTASGQTAKVASMVTMDGRLAEASEGDAVTLTLSKDIDASRGDVLSLNQQPLDMTDQFEATLVWLHEDAGLVGRSYDIKLATQWASASLTTIKHRVNINTLAHDACTALALNDIAVCNIAVSKPLVFDSYAQSKALGSFILVDRFTHATVAAGMVRHSLRRAQNVHQQALSVTRTDREQLNGHQGKVIWFTGLSGSGKSTLANALAKELHAQGKRTYVLDGDNVRQGLNKDLGFTDADRVENIRRVAEVAKLMMDAGLIVMTAFISPFRAEREMARELIGVDNFVEVYVSTPLEVCERRDVKGLYRKARAGKLPNMTGIGSNYEDPLAPQFVLETDNQSIRQSLSRLIGSI